MKLNLNCILCNIKQILTVTDFVQLDSAKKEEIMRDALGYLHGTNYERSNPEVIKGTWDIITQYIDDNDPYKKIKSYYNQEILNSADSIRKLIDQSEDKFDAALKIAITANLIDFAASHTFDEKMLLEKIAAIHAQTMPIDDSKILYEKLKTATTLLYLGDNCGEIVIDKIFIEYIQAEFPNLKVYFGVRGEPIVNDVTVEDATMVHMQEVAEVISNGDGSLGTVIEKTSPAFREIFYKADAIIAKGQGNYESLSEIDREHIFFLFMAKCDAVANSLKVDKLSIVCAEYHLEA
ncbi:MAG: ARMT1-like domain-containing protein [Sporomusaceae bacterium]|nr:ARMT1-like domain-containing protein [Sporomusaceae bacterium]